jgi:cytosine/adenosine deaminase-related metal-dependent hydrolase
MILRARLIVTMAGPPIEDGAVVVEGGRIAAVGSHAEIRHCFGRAADCIDLGEQALFPGLINAHCHLDYTGMRGAIAPGQPFSRWIGCINALKREFTEADYLRAIADGFAELKRWGTTTVCNLEAFPALLPLLPPPPIRTWWFPELIDIRNPAAAREQVAAGIAILADLRGRPGWLGGFGLNPHAPYTASPELYRLCAEAAGGWESPGSPQRLLLTTHIAESGEEEAMFGHGCGPLFDFLKTIGRPMADCGGRSAFSNAVQSGLIGPGWLLAHANELGEDDFALIAAHSPACPGGARWEIVHCPRSHAFFTHRPFAWRRLAALGVGISLGTDSLASNDTLSLFDELKSARKSAPWLTSEQLMETVTLQPAKAL